jgi:group I intron endonuclease
MMSNSTFIYSLSDENHNIRYIGKSFNIKKRLRDHICEAKKEINTHKNRWIMSLLKNGVYPVIEIIDEVPSSEWEFWERFYICLFKSWGIQLTNNTEGGNGTGSGINNPNYGRKLTEEHKHKCSLKLRGEKNPFYGKKHSPEILEKFCKPVLQYSNSGDFIKLWSSIKEAESKLKLHSISSCCHKKLLSVGGFIWRFKNDDKYPLKIIVTKSYRKPVFQFTTEGIFIKKWNSVSQAKKEYNIHGISNVCNNRKSYKTSGGYIWRYDYIE